MTTLLTIMLTLLGFKTLKLIVLGFSRGSVKWHQLMINAMDRRTREERELYWESHGHYPRHEVPDGLRFPRGADHGAK